MEQLEIFCENPTPDNFKNMEDLYKVIINRS